MRRQTELVDKERCAGCINAAAYSVEPAKCGTNLCIESENDGSTGQYCKTSSGDILAAGGEIERRTKV